MSSVEEQFYNSKLPTLAMGSDRLPTHMQEQVLNMLNTWKVVATVGKCHVAMAEPLIL